MVPRTNESGFRSKTAENLAVAGVWLLFASLVLFVVWLIRTLVGF